MGSRKRKRDSGTQQLISKFFKSPTAKRPVKPKNESHARTSSFFKPSIKTRVTEEENVISMKYTDMSTHVSKQETKEEPTTSSYLQIYQQRQVTNRKHKVKITKLSQISSSLSNVDSAPKPTNQTSPEKPRIQLSPEQKYILDAALDGKSFFFTGCAGTGKSFLLREIVRELRKRYHKNRIYVTAPTGVSACNIGGCTLHRFVSCEFTVNG